MNKVFWFSTDSISSFSQDSTKKERVIRHGRILPLIDHKLASQLSAEGAALFPPDAENAGDGHMVFCPTGRLIAGIAGIHRNAAVVLLHQPDVGGGQFVAPVSYTHLDVYKRQALIETRLKYHAAGVDTGGIFLLAAHCHRLRCV